MQQNDKLLDIRCETDPQFSLHIVTELIMSNDVNEFNTLTFYSLIS